LSQKERPENESASERKRLAMKKLRFLHIPKTAGSSFVQCLRRIYGRGKHFFGFTGFLKEDLKRYSKLNSKSEINLFAGHFNRITGIKEIDELQTITFLREPVSRVKSFCQHVWEGKTPQLTKLFPPGRFNLDDFLDSDYFELKNLQLRMLTGYQAEITKHNSRQLVEEAVNILKNDITSFGLTESFDTSLMLFREIFKWPWPTYRKMNIKKKSNLIDIRSEHIEKIEKLNHADIELYKAASVIFHARIKNNKEQISSALSEFERHQRIFQMYSWIYGILGSIRKKISPPEWYIAAHPETKQESYFRRKSTIRALPDDLGTKP
jgi:hypothetical protein